MRSAGGSVPSLPPIVTNSRSIGCSSSAGTRASPGRLARIGRRQGRPQEHEVDPLLGTGTALHRHADRGWRHVEGNAGNRDRHRRRVGRHVGELARPQHEGDIGRGPEHDEPGDTGGQDKACRGAPAPARCSAADWLHADAGRITSAVDLKFLHHWRQARLGTSNRKAALVPRTRSSHSHAAESDCDFGSRNQRGMKARRRIESER